MVYNTAVTSDSISSTELAVNTSHLLWEQKPEAAHIKTRFLPALQHFPESQWQVLVHSGHQLHPKSPGECSGPQTFWGKALLGSSERVCFPNLKELLKIYFPEKLRTFSFLLSLNILSLLFLVLFGHYMEHTCFRLCFLNTAFPLCPTAPHTPFLFGT